MKRLVLSLCISLLIFIASAEKFTIAVLDLKTKDVPQIVVNAVTNIIRTEFINIKNFTVIERAQIEEILKEQEKALADFSDENQAVQIGKLLSARKIIVGEIAFLGKGLLITIRIVDVQTGVSEYSAKEKAEDLNAVDKVAVSIARDLARRIVEKNKEFFAPISLPGYYLRSIIPGLGQFYSEHPVEGVLFSGAFLASAGVTVYGLTNFFIRKTEYDTAQSNFDVKAAAVTDAQNIYYAGLISCASVYILHWADVLLFSMPKDDTDKDEEKSKLSWSIESVRNSPAVCIKISF